MHEPPILRRATPADAVAIATIHVESWREAYRGIVPDATLDGLSVDERAAARARQLEAARDPEDATIVAEIAGRMAGFAIASSTRDPDADPATVGEVRALYVAPSAWRRGLGRLLLDASLEHLQECGLDDVTLWVFRDNAASRSFYEACGFDLDGATREHEVGGARLAVVRYRRTTR